MQFSRSIMAVPVDSAHHRQTIKLTAGYEAMQNSHPVQRLVG
jgi:hypothetical protein